MNGSRRPKDEFTLQGLHTAIMDLYSTIGVRDIVDPDMLEKAYENGGVNELVSKIAFMLGLNVRCNIIYVNDRFDSNLPPASIEIPSDIGSYSWNNMQGLILSIKLSQRRAFDHGALGLSVLLSHELAHIILHVIKHPRMESEICTDLTAMMLGFANIYNEGRQKVETDSYTTYGLFSHTRHTRTNTSTFGYLNDGHFSYAHNMIMGFLYKDNASRKKLKKLKDLISKTEILLSNNIKKFNHTLSDSKHISSKEMIKIKKFYDVTYLEEYEILVNKAKEIIYKIDKLLGLHCQTKGGIEVVEKSIHNVNDFYIKLRHQNKKLHNDIIQIKLIRYENPIIKTPMRIYFNLFG